MKKFYFLLSLIFVVPISAQQNTCNLIVGTYTNSCQSNGIYVYDFNLETGDCTLKNNTSESVNPSFLNLSDDKTTLYAVNENGQNSTVSSFKFDKDQGKLDLINIQDAGGADPCHIINDKNHTITANYSGGNIAVFGKNNDGSLTPAKQIIQHFGKSINTERQNSPHPHMVYFSNDKKYVLANDLGTDKIYIYNYNPIARTSILELKSETTLKAGIGPRHLTMSKDGKWVYVLQELSGNISGFKFSKGKLKLVFETTVLDVDFKDAPRAADIHISADGKFLYASNRGTANDISIFEILKSGYLKFIARNSTLGNGPRNFAIDPSGNFLLVANQFTNNIVIFKRDKTTGLLTDTGKNINLCSPVCLIFDKD
jgi:6-phosphogluconolactonase